MRAMVELTRDEVSDLQYPVVVEMWDKKNDGQRRRRWLAEFTEAERVKAKYWYDRFYRWYLVTGPREVVMSPRTLLWLNNKLIPFFGGL
jgi:hypothetical protein